MSMMFKGPRKKVKRGLQHDAEPYTTVENIRLAVQGFSLSDSSQKS
jgi:hypothetical protein